MEYIYTAADMIGVYEWNIYTAADLIGVYEWNIYIQLVI